MGQRITRSLKSCVGWPKPPRVQIPKWIAKKTYDRCLHRCYYCARDIAPFEHRKDRFEIDHLHPLAKYGKNHKVVKYEQVKRNLTNNYVIACFDCNRTKSQKTAEQFFEERGLERRCVRPVPCQGVDKKNNQEDIFCLQPCISNAYKYCWRHSV